MKNLFKEQVEYLKDNPKKYWFKRKLYGWGWTPAKPAGWIVLGVYLVLIVLGMKYYETHVGIQNEPRAFIAFLFTCTLGLIIIAWRTGEKPKWQWGRDTTSKRESEE